MPARPGHRPILLDAAAGVLLVSLFCTAVWWMLFHIDRGLNWGRVWENRELLTDGWLLTLAVSAGAMPGSCLVAALLIAGNRSRLASLRWASRGFVEVIRGMPLLSLILIGYFVFFAEDSVRRFLDGIGLGGRLFSGIALLSIFTAAYLSEILRGGLDSIPQGQIDSARAVGFNRPQILRYVILPQALRRVLPALAGQFVDLVKSSSLLSVIGIQEFTNSAKAYNSKTYGGIEAFLMLAAGYLLITLPIAWFAHWMEKRFRYQM